MAHIFLRGLDGRAHFYIVLISFKRIVFYIKFFLGEYPILKVKIYGGFLSIDNSK